MQDNPTSRAGIAPELAVLGGAVRELRGHRRISQEELGFRARLHRNYVGAIERGEINPTFRTLLRLADGLGVSFGTLVRLYERRHVGAEPRHGAEERAVASRPPVAAGGRRGGESSGALRSSCR